MGAGFREQGNQDAGLPPGLVRLEVCRGGEAMSKDEVLSEIDLGCLKSPIGLARAFFLWCWRTPS